MSKRRAMAFVILAALIAGCAPPQPAPACGGTFAFVMTTEGVKSANLHLADACHGGPLMLPDDAGPALDGWVSCDRADPSTFPAWSPDGSRLLYVSDYYYSGHGEVRVLDVSTRTARVLAPSYIMLDAATGQVVKQNCANPDECHFSEIRDGQVTFVNSQNPHWSPDGTAVAFDSMVFGDNPPQSITYRHFVMDSGGADIRLLTDQEVAGLLADWDTQRTPTPDPPALNTQSVTSTVTVACAVWHP